MIFTTAGEMIQAALELLGAVDPDETLGNAEASKALKFLNLLLDAWSADRGKIFIRTEDTKVLTVGDGNYTIGAAADIDTVTPVKIEQAFLRDSNGNDSPLRVNMTQAEYNALTVKGQTNIPGAIYFTGGTDPATIYFDYAPDQAYTLYLFSHKPLTKITDINTQVVVPDGYEAALTHVLALWLASPFQVPVPEIVARTAARLEQTIDGKSLELPPAWQNYTEPETMNWSRGGSSSLPNGIWPVTT